MTFDNGSTSNGKTKAQVIIVGAGPVGLLIALGLGQAGIDVLVLEAHHELLQTTRAVVYMPVVLSVMRKLGILDRIIDMAYLNKEGVRWLDLNGNELAHLPIGNKNDGGFDGVLLLGQWKLNSLILEELRHYPNVEVRFDCRIVGIEDRLDHDHVRIMTHNKSLLDNDTFFEAKYVVATDGANSAVRRMLCIPFEGFTYQDFKMVGTDVIYDFAGQEGFHPLNFVVHEKEWAVIVYTAEEEDHAARGSGKPQWRVAYGEDPNLPSGRQDYFDRAHERIKKYIGKGHGNFRVVRAEPYLMQQRVAAEPRKGRVVLAGDALHSNNPMGGLGLTTGILDAFCYGNALRRVINDGEADKVLTECAASRRSVWVEVTNQMSRANLERLFAMDPETTKARDGFFSKLNDPVTSSDFAGGMRKAFDSMLPNDFSKSR